MKDKLDFARRSLWWWLLVMTCGALAQMEEPSKPRQSSAGEEAIQELKRVQTNEDFNLHYGHVGFRAEAGLAGYYTDNVLLSEANRQDDFVVTPEVILGASVPLSELNTLKMSVGVGYEWFTKNHSLNQDAPLVSPDSELVFNVFVKDFHIKLYDNFSYQQTLVINDQPVGQERVFNFTNVTQFNRLNNFVGPTVEWDLNKVVLTAGYCHEDFISYTEEFKYLTRATEWITNSMSYLLGEQRKVGLESLAGYTSYAEQTVLNNNWRWQFGPFGEMKVPDGILVRIGGGYDMARYDSLAVPGNNYDTGYAYAKASQELRLFNHSLEGGRQTVLGDNANNLRIDYVRYSINSDLIKNINLEGHALANFCREFGGSYEEHFKQYVAGLQVGYQFHKHWRGEVGYEYYWNDSDLEGRTFNRNLVSLGVNFRF